MMEGSQAMWERWYIATNIELKVTDKFLTISPSFIANKVCSNRSLDLGGGYNLGYGLCQPHLSLW